jgi:hypothetical protein
VRRAGHGDASVGNTYAVKGATAHHPRPEYKHGAKEFCVELGISSVAQRYARGEVSETGTV